MQHRKKLRRSQSSPLQCCRRLQRQLMPNTSNKARIYRSRSRRHQPPQRTPYTIKEPHIQQQATNSLQTCVHADRGEVAAEVAHRADVAGVNVSADS